MVKRVLKKDNYLIDSWEYIVESKRYIYFAAILFLFGTIFGIVFHAKLGSLDEVLKALVDQVKDLGLVEMIWFIFKNNSISAFFALFLGIFFGIFAMFNAAFNGIILGYVFQKAVSKEGILIGWKLLPHGIFELPAILIAIGLGIRLGLGFFEQYSSFSYLFSPGDKKRNKTTFASRFYSSLKVFFFVILPLLAVAAVIEGLLIFFSN